MNLIKLFLDLLKLDSNSFEDIIIEDVSTILIKHYKDISKFTLETIMREWINYKTKPIQLDSIYVIEIKIYKNPPLYKYNILVMITHENSIITLKSNPKPINPNLLDKQILAQLEETSECILSFK